MKHPILREVIHGLKADGTHVEIVVEVGALSRYKGRPDEWTCTLKAPTLHYPNAPIHGASALQALCLALSSARMALTYFREDGGKLGQEIGQDDYDVVSTFGIGDLTRKP